MTMLLKVISYLNTNYSIICYYNICALENQKYKISGFKGSKIGSLSNGGDKV